MRVSRPSVFAQRVGVTARGAAQDGEGTERGTRRR